jgi:pimeloyl-ACP methyl ester carboxylesterase
LPLIMTHGWPGSVIELLETVGPLTDPTAHGGQAEDAFHLVLPSLPGYGFSGEPTELGWESGRIARAWAELMDRLGYTRYVAQGGDVGESHAYLHRAGMQRHRVSVPLSPRTQDLSPTSHTPH